MLFLRTALAALGLMGSAPLALAGYWMDEVPHLGVSPYHPDLKYKVYRNVKAYGAKGDGVTDDTAAINRAISDGNRCAPRVCLESTVSPATVYFPAGTYLISGSIVDYFYTQLIGDPTNPPVIKASANFPTTTTLGLLDGNRYGANGLAWKSVNVFYRQVRNLIFDTTAIPATSNAVAIHWPSSQATIISNVQFRLSDNAQTQHVGLFIEEGSGGMLTDLQFQGGFKAARLGNQQYTARNWSFRNAKTAIEQLWDWGWTYQRLAVVNCNVAISIPDASTGSVTLLDSTFSNVAVAIQTGVDQPNAKYPAANSLVLYNSVFDRVTAIVKSPTRLIYAGAPGTTVTVPGFVQGRIYTPTGPTQYAGTNAAYFPIPGALRQQTYIYTRAKPQYADVATANVVTARSFGAKGDGRTDDTRALQSLLAYLAANPTKLGFVDAGHYLVTDTVVLQPGSRLVGEALASYIIGTGAKFQSQAAPRAVVRVGTPGQAGVVEWSDMIVSTRGPAAGAKLIEWNLASPASTPSGMWDVHTRVGGYAGSQLQLAQCAATPGSAAVKPGCVAAFMSMHITASASNLLLEGSWFWVADHDLEDSNYGQVTIYAGRGLLVESRVGGVWLIGVGSEHHTMYQFQLAGTQNVYMANAQSETPYYQPNPGAMMPFAVNAALNDPDFAAACANGNGVLAKASCAMAWGLRVIGSKNIAVFGAGFYSFFNNNSDACAQESSPVDCQARMVDVLDGAGATTTGLVIYNLNTIGSAGMVRRYGADVALAAGSASGFANNLALYKH